MELKKSACRGESRCLYVVELPGEAPPLPFVHGRPAKHKVSGTAASQSAVPRLVDVQNMHARKKAAERVLTPGEPQRQLSQSQSQL
jgi:hypothetical protein